MTTRERIEKQIRIDFARSGGIERAKNMTKAAKKAHAIKMNEARWDKSAKAKS